MALETGEALVDWYIRNPNHTCDTSIAAYAYELARLYEISSVVTETFEAASKERKRASHWYSFAASLWESYGEKASEIVQDLGACAENVKGVAI